MTAFAFIDTEQAQNTPAEPAPQPPVVIDELFQANRVAQGEAEEREHTALLLDLSNFEAVDTIMVVLKDAPADQLKPISLKIAAESLRHVARKYPVAQTAGFARESFAQTLKDTAVEARDALVAKAKAALNSIAASISKRLSNMNERLKLKLRLATRFDKTWVEDVQSIISKAKAARGAPVTEGVFFDNRVKVAHFTDGNFEVHTNASDMKDDFAATYRAFNEVGAFLSGFKKVFDLKADGTRFNFKSLKSSIKPSSFGKDRLTLSGNLALFGEEQSVANIGGTSLTIDDVLANIRSVSFQTTQVWKLSDVRQPRLPVMPAIDILRESQALLEMAEMVSIQSSRWSQDIGAFENDAFKKVASGFFDNMDFWKTPKNFVTYARAYTGCVLGFSSVLGGALHNQAAALLCLCDYYKWSLAHHDLG